MGAVKFIEGDNKKSREIAEGSNASLIQMWKDSVGDNTLTGTLAVDLYKSKKEWVGAKLVICTDCWECSNSTLNYITLYKQMAEFKFAEDLDVEVIVVGAKATLEDLEERMENIIQHLKVSSTETSSES